jgi:hypothetical protein
VEEEPRVWQEKCIVCERAPDGSRVLHVLRTADGVPRYRQRFAASDLPLSPALGPREVVVNGDKGLEGWAVGERMLTKRWTSKVAARAFVRRGDTLWVVTAKDVVRCRASKGPDRDAVTQTTERTLGGGVAVRGDDLRVVGWDERGNTEVLSFDAETLRERWSTFVGNHPAGTFEKASLAAGHDIFVRAGRALATASGGPADTVHLDALAGAPALLETTSLPAFPPRGFLVVWREGGAHQLVRPHLGRTPDGGILFDVYASTSDRPALVDVRVQPTTAGNVVYLGGTAFDVATRDVFREAPLPSEQRVVAVRDLLLLTSGSRVTAYREERGPQAPSALRLRPPEAATTGPFPVDSATVALADGAYWRGSFSADPTAGTITATGRGMAKRTVSLADVGAIVTSSAPHRLLHARDGGWAVAAVEAVVEREAAREWLAVAKQAIAAGATEEARALLDEAAAREADEKEIDKAASAIDAAPAKTPDAEKAEAVKKRVAALRARPLEAVWSAFEALPPDAPFPLRTALVRHVLSRDPAHAGAAAWVRARVPEAIPVRDPFEPAEWLRLVEVAHGTPVALVAPPQKGERDLTYAQRQLGSALHFWRPDLIGIESGPLVILTPLDRPSRVAKCLAAGRRVCDFLETLFAGGTAKRDTRFPLTHHLYATKEEYLAESTKQQWGPREESLRVLEHSAGHYSREAEASRMFLPPDDDAFEQVVSTYAHELTHHWVDVRCPWFTDAERAGGGAPGYWVVEGIAEYVAELRFDFATSEPPTPDPRAFSLDVVAHAPEKALLPWEVLFEATHADRGRMANEAKTLVPMRWKLGSRRRLSQVNFFYAQASAASHYLLLGDGEKHRTAYLTYLADQYRGRIEKGAIAARFGMTPAELGARVVAWCRERVGGASESR